MWILPKKDHVLTDYHKYLVKTLGDRKYLGTMISKFFLRRLVESVLLEGFKDDQRYLVEKYPDHAQDLEGLQPKWISWLTARFGERPKAEETHPFEDAIVTIKNFSKKDAAIGEKYKANEQFKASVDESFPPKSRSWKSPTDATTMTVDEMELILGLSERKKERFKNDVSEEEMESDRVGKVGPWNLWMPTTKERSCKIAGYDPVTRRPKTTWCTARMAGSNLFYNYIGRPGIDMTLFYVIKDNPTDNEDWLSVGFVNGKPVLEGMSGGVSVNRANEGLTPESLQDALGKHHDAIMMSLTEKNKSLDGKHPARQKIKDAAQNVASLGYLTQGLSKNDAEDIIKVVVKEPDINPEVLEFLFSSNPVVYVREAVASNPSTPAETLKALAIDIERSVRKAVASNPSAPAETLQALALNGTLHELVGVASNPSTPVETLKALAGNLVLIRINVASNPSTPAETLQALAIDNDYDVRERVASNPSTPAETLRALTSDKFSEVRVGVARNLSTPAETLQALTEDWDFDVRSAVASNPSTPAEALQVLARDADRNVRNTVAKNPSTPAETLQAFARDPSFMVQKTAANSLAARGQGLNERQLRRLIRQMM